MDNHNPQTTHEYICDQALKHYEEVSHIAKHWVSTVPVAIEFYRKNFKSGEDLL